MKSEPSLAFQISRDFSELHCDLHHLGLSTRVSKDFTVVKVCCKFFRQEAETALEKKFGNNYVSTHIRFQLPAIDHTGISINGSIADE